MGDQAHLLLIRPRTWRRIFSACSNAAFEQGLKIAKQNHAELLIAHSSALPNTLCYLPSDCYAEWEKKRRAEAEKNSDALIGKARHENVKAHALALEGIADDAIEDAAKRLGVDLIVIGANALGAGSFVGA
jgi:nucleotide-binding universal stress UspA family protein